MLLSEWLLWLAIGIVAYTYIGYGVAIWLISLLIQQKSEFTDALPRLTLLIAAFNEADIMAAKIRNSLALDYPRDLLDIVVVTDGSSDETCQIVASFEPQGVRLEFQPERKGKNNAVNRVAPHVSGEIIVFSDANAMFRTDALKKLVRHFGDPNVALVAGEKQVQSDETTVGQSEGLYWRYESLLKRLDSKVSSVMGAAGEIFAVRKDLFLTHSPGPDVIIEDFVISMGLIRSGFRVVYEPEAIATECASASMGDEFKRKVRIVAGGWQAVCRLRALMMPRFGIIAFQFLSHRVLRWMVTPFLLPIIAILNLELAGMPTYRVLGCIQITLYSLAVAGWYCESKGHAPAVTRLPFFFVFLNFAALAGAWRFFTGSQSVVWEKAKRKPDQMAA